MSLEEEYQATLNTLYLVIRERLDRFEISEQEAERLRDEVYDTVTKVYDNDNDSWCSSTWSSSSEDCM